MSVRRDYSTPEEVPGAAKMCETIPADNRLADWERDNREVSIVPRTRDEADLEEVLGQSITTSADDLVFLEEMR